MTDEIKVARKQLGAFFKKRREEMGQTVETLAAFLEITPNTVHGVESGRFAWDVDLQHRLCAALEIKPYFAVTDDPRTADPLPRENDDPERYHGFYFSENLLLYPDQAAITKLTYPRLFVRFAYTESYFSSFNDWLANHTEMEWLDPNDRPTDPDEIESILIDCWNFLELYEREEDRLTEMDDDE